MKLQRTMLGDESCDRRDACWDDFCYTNRYKYQRDLSELVREISSIRNIELSTCAECPGDKFRGILRALSVYSYTEKPEASFLGHHGSDA